MLVANNTATLIGTHDKETQKTMKAITQTQYGSPETLKFTDAAKPVIGDNDVLIRVNAASVCKGDVHLLSGKPYLIRLIGYGFLRPKHTIPGQNVAGRVETIGKNVTSLRPGDEVFGEVTHGAFAQYICAPSEKFALKPSNLSFEQAAAVPDSGLTALQGLRNMGNLQPGQNVLINGASGGVGTFAVQIAKALGGRVTAVCSTRHTDKVRSIGADHIIDYTKDDFTESDIQYDLILDLVGNHTLTDYKRVMSSNGVFVSSAAAPGKNWIGPIVWMLKVMLVGICSSQKMSPFIMTPCKDDLVVLKELIEAGKVMPVIEQRYPLSKTSEAIAHVAHGHAQGKTVISMDTLTY